MKEVHAYTNEALYKRNKSLNFVYSKNTTDDDFWIYERNSQYTKYWVNNLWIHDRIADSEIEMIEIDKDLASDLIMQARAPWFESDHEGQVSTEESSVNK